MNQILLNRLGRILLAAAVCAVALGALAWWAASTQVALADDSLPTSQVRSPEDGAVITERGTLAITGVAWDASIPRPFPGEPVLLPIENFGGAGDYYVRWTEAISATHYVLQEADNSEFSGATSFSTSDTEYFIAGQGVGTYYYRVKAYNTEGRPSRWSNVESVVVQSTGESDFSPTLALPLASVTPAHVTASGPVTVWVSIDGGAWQTATVTANAGGWWDWTYAWSLPEEQDAQHTIQTQARDEVGNLSAIDTITVTVDNRYYLVYFPFIFKRWPPVPYAPTLNNIDNTDGDGDYTVRWSYDYTDPPVSTYTLQEATDANFTTNRIDYNPGSSTSYAVSGKAPGTYYYRVRGHNTWGPGDWSNVKSVTVQVLLHDDFDDPSTGWRTRRTSSPDLDLVNATYSGGRLVTRVNDRFDFGIFSPMFQALGTPYRMCMRTRIIHKANEVSYGIVFGGNGGTPCPVDRSNADDSDGCFFHYYRLNVIWGGDYLKYQVKRIEYHEGAKGKARGTELLPWVTLRDEVSPDGWNVWEIKVYDDGFAVYVNGHLLGWTDDTTFIHEPYYGILVSAYEYNSASFEHEYFYLDPLSTGEALPDSGYLVPGGVNWYQPLPQMEQVE